jgi:hypothetical protein
MWIRKHAESILLRGEVMGINVKELTKPSALVPRGGAKPVALETTPRPKDTAAGTLASQAEQRATSSKAQRESPPPPARLNTTA